MMTELNKDTINYRGYTFVATERASSWRVFIFPGPGLSHTIPDHITAASTKDEALAKARASVDLHFSR